MKVGELIRELEKSDKNLEKLIQKLKRLDKDLEISIYDELEKYKDLIDIGAQSKFVESPKGEEIAKEYYLY